VEAARIDEEFVPLATVFPLPIPESRPTVMSTHKNCYPFAASVLSIVVAAELWKTELTLWK
jgi:hypothetical protein